MPELPEVEIVRQSLNKKINQKRVKKVIIRNRNLRFLIPNNFKSYIKNKKIIKVDRFSKYLIIHFLEGDYCLVHLGMSGTIHIIDRFKISKFTNTSFYNSQILPKKHNHIEIFFSDLKIVYNDPRRFGFFQIIESDDLLRKRLSHLGPEPFDTKFNKRYLTLYFRNKEKNIKNFLIDQHFVSGIGNIYASEILFLSKINPSKKAKLLKEVDCKRIITNSKKVLFAAINSGGSSIRDFKNVSGIKGSFQDDFKVYQRENLKCKRYKCSGIIIKKVISNRSTFFCNTCQK